MASHLSRFCLCLLLTAVALTVLPREAAAVFVVQPWNSTYLGPSTVPSGSGNGTLDFRFFTGGGSEVKNTAPGFNGDNGNNSLLSAGWDESFVTSGADLKAFYTLNFGYTQPGQTEILLFLDLNETGGGKAVNTLDKFTIISNPTTINGLSSPSLAYTGDVSSSQQNAITDGVNVPYTGGTVLTTLYQQPYSNLPIYEQGAGWADYMFRTGIDPFTLNDSDILLFNIKMSNLDNGTEEWFISGTYALSDFIANVYTPEPGTGLLVGAGLAGLAWRHRRRKK